MDDVKFSLDLVDKTFIIFKQGSKVSGTVVSSTGDGYIINIGGKKDGLVPFDDLSGEELKIGSTIEAVIVKTKDENTGAVVLSKHRADQIKKGNELAGNLKVGDSADFIITSATNSGLVSKIGMLSVFIPASQVSFKNIDLSKFVNSQVKAQILEIDLINNKIIASIKAYDRQEKLTQKQNFWKSLFLDKIVKGTVSHYTDFGVFVKVDGVDCLVHNSEVSYDKNADIKSILELSKEYDFKVIKLDEENEKVSLSYKALFDNPLKEDYAKYKTGDVVEGEVKKILPFGAIISLGKNVDGMLHIKEASAYYVKNIYEVAKVGQILKLKIIDINYDALKISLSLKALQEDEISQYITKD